MASKKEQDELALVRSEPVGLPAPAEPVAGPSILGIIQFASQSGITPEGLEKLVAMWREEQARIAEREFADAMRRFQSRCPKIRKNRAVRGSFSFDYATLDHVAEIIQPHLDECGLSYSFDSEITETNGVASVKVRTILRHAGGHKEIVTFAAPIDKGARMNEPQKVASALSYARRYGLLLALGISTGGEDDDGNRAGGTGPITEAQAMDLEALIEEVSADRQKFLAFLRVSRLTELPSRDYQRAVDALERKRNGGGK